MAQWGKELADKPDKPRTIPGFHVAEGEDQLLQTALWPPPTHELWHMQALHIHINTQINKIEFKNKNKF